MRKYIIIGLFLVGCTEDKDYIEWYNNQERLKKEMAAASVENERISKTDIDSVWKGYYPNLKVDTTKIPYRFFDITYHSGGKIIRHDTITKLDKYCVNCKELSTGWHRMGEGPVYSEEYIPSKENFSYQEGDTLIEIGNNLIIKSWLVYEDLYEVVKKQ